MKGKILGLICASLLIINTGTAEASAIFKWSFSPDSLSKTEMHFSYPGTTPLNGNSLLTLPLKTVYLYSDCSLTDSDFFVAADDMIEIGTISRNFLQFDDKITSLDSIYKTPRLQYL